MSSHHSEQMSQRSQVSKVTIEWNGLWKPLGSMVFRWFWGQATIGFDGFRWLSTIGTTMEWLHTIVEV